MKFITILFLFSFSFSLQAVDYFVSTTGTAGATGTSIDPLLSVQAALDLCSSGDDNVWLAEGIYNEQISISDKNGISISSVDASFPAILSGNGFTTQNQILIQNSSQISLANFTVENLYVQGAKAVYVVGQGSGISISNLTIKNVGWGNDATADPESFTPIRQAHGILINGRTILGYQNIYIGYCTLEDMVVGNSETITLTGNTYNFLVEENTILRSTNIGIDIAGHFPGAIDDGIDATLNQARSGRVRANTISECRRPTVGNEPAAIYVDGGKDVIIDQNTVFQNGTGISAGCENFNVTASGITIANNFIHSNDKFGTVFGANAGDLASSVFRNNTLFNNGIYLDNSGSLSLQKTTCSLIANNIIYTTSQDYFGLSLFGFLVNDLTLTHNLFYGTDGNTARMYVFSAAANSSSTVEAINFQDPQLVDIALTNPDLHISTTSPAVNAGLNTITSFDTEVDIDGSLRTYNGTDIGADEIQCTADLNLDKSINTADVLALVSNLGCTSSCTYSVDGDTDVDTADLLAIITLLGTDCF